jgi:desumoylating isopeptidase 1
MYRRPSATTASTSVAPSNMDLGASLLQAVASQAASRSSRAPYPTPVPTPPRAAQSTLTAPLQIVTNPASFRTLIASHRCVAVFFTSPTCAPCRIVEPVFEDLAQNKASGGVAFAKVDLATGLGSQVAGQWSVRATPTFLFFLDGKKARIIACVRRVMLTFVHRCTS